MIARSERPQITRGEARRLLAAHAREHGPTPRAVAPLAVEIGWLERETAGSLFDRERGARPAPDDPAQLCERAVSVRPVPRPLFWAALIEGCSAKPTGPRSLVVPAAAGHVRRALWTVPGECLYGPRSLAQGLRAGGRAAELARLVSVEMFLSIELPPLAESAESGPLANCAVVATPLGSAQAGYSALSLKLVTVPREGSAVSERGGTLDLWPRGAPHRAKPLYPDEAVELCHRAQEQGLEVSDPDSIRSVLEALVRRSAVVRARPGFPNRAFLVEGSAVGAPCRRSETQAAHAEAVARARAEAGDVVSVDERVRDVARMARAERVSDPRAIGPQAEAIARYLETDYGLLLALGTGCGKTPTWLFACGLKARALEGWRGLCVVQKQLRSQWLAEIADKLPAARVCAPEPGGGSVARELVRSHREAGREPLLCLATYEQVRSRPEDLRALYFDDLAVDEGGQLDKPETRLAQSLWMLRKRAATVAVLSATPISRGIRDLECVIAWIREDRELLDRRLLSREFSAPATLAMERFAEVCGPVVARFTREHPELRRRMPQLAAATTVLIDPTAEERALHRGLHREIARHYGELLGLVERLAALRPDDRKLGEAREELSGRRASAQGIVLSAIPLALAAACAPEVLAESQALVAKLVRSAGLVEPAVRAGGAKREVVAQTIAQAVGQGEPVLCFCTNAAAPLRHLAGALARDHGVEMGVLTGETPPEERERTARRFMAGELSALGLSRAYMRGLNLQRAKVVVHLDLPWLFSDFEQRNGRAARLGGDSLADVAVLVPVMRGLVDEKVAQHLLPRAHLAHAALDGPRGQAVRESEVARQLGSVAGELSRDREASLRLRIAAQIYAEAGAGA